jgi:hypothetical protein
MSEDVPPYGGKPVEMTSTLESHALHLGGLIGNFQSLEFVLRAFLHKQPNARPLGAPYGTDIYLSPVGTTLAESDITSFDSLGQLIDKYNVVAASRNLPNVDRTLVDIRDALAHGRVSAPAESERLRLIKYGRPSNGRVRVEFNVEMSGAWLIEQKRRVFEAMIAVHTVITSETARTIVPSSRTDPAASA